HTHTHTHTHTNTHTHTHTHTQKERKMWGRGTYLSHTCELFTSAHKPAEHTHTHTHTHRERERLEEVEQIFLTPVSFQSERNTAQTENLSLVLQEVCVCACVCVCLFCCFQLV